MNLAMSLALTRLLRRAALAAALAAGSATASAGILHVSIDTAAFSAASGYLDMQLSASAGVPLATVAVSNMVGFGAIDLNYGVSPAAGGFIFRNDTSNYLSHTVVFGGTLSFDLTFAGDHDPLTRYVSRFLVSAYDEALSPLGVFDPATGALAGFSWIPGLSANAAGSVGATLADPHVTVVPEPAGLLLVAMGMAAMALAPRRRPRPSQTLH